MIKKIVISFFLVVLVSLSLTETLDTKSSEQLDSALARSLTTFAAARALNGLVSVVQGTEINISPVGMGATFAPGQFLDPVNDMVERFSWVMLMSSVSIGAQEMMLHLGKTTLFKTLFALFTVLLLLQLWIPQLRESWSISLSLKTVIVLTLLRFSVPGIVMINELVYEAVLAPQYERSMGEVVRTSSEVTVMIEDIQEQEQQLDKERSFMDKLNVSKQYEEFKQTLKERVNAFIETFNEAMESIIRLITVFIINSIVVPLGALWFFIYGTSALLRQEFLLEFE